MEPTARRPFAFLAASVGWRVDMSASDRVSDWQVAGIAASEGAVLCVGGFSVFYFSSRSARFSDMFILPRGGLGLTFGAGGVSLPNLGIPGQDSRSSRRFDLEYSPIHARQPFSAEDLHGAVGTLLGGGVSAIGGHDWVWITARTLSRGTLFEHQPCHGYVAGVHAGGTTMVGVWICMTFAANAIGDSVNPNITI